MYIAGPLADGFEAFENLDLVGAVLVDIGCSAVAVVAGGDVCRIGVAGLTCRVGLFHVVVVAQWLFPVRVVGRAWSVRPASA